MQFPKTIYIEKPFRQCTLYKVQRKPVDQWFRRWTCKSMGFENHGSKPCCL